MIELLIMRHAKSDWDAGAAGDHERPLAERGTKAARTVGRFLTAADSVPDLIVTSTAVRARTTAELAAEAGGWRCPIEQTRAFYDSEPREVVAEIAARPAPPRLMVVGHDPTWSELVTLLAGGGSVRLATAAVACLELGVDGWSQIAPGTGRLLWLVTPKLLQAAGA